MDTSEIFSTVDNYRSQMHDALTYLWENPETGFNEWRSNEYMMKAFESLGYSLVSAKNIPGFYTDISTGRKGPKILVLCELDALLCANHPASDKITGAVHACGHCAQCAAMLGIAAALKAPGALDKLSGSIRLCVVPAEELIQTEAREELRKKGIIKYYGGKVEFLHRGYFKGCDMAFMAHTQGGKPHSFYLYKGGNGCLIKNVTYKGRAAHAGGAPQYGINALYAANIGLSAVNALRETFSDNEHIRAHHIMTVGGSAANAIPDTVKLESCVRGASVDAILKTNKKVNRAFAGAALAMGANVILSDRPGYMPLNNDATMNQCAFEAFQSVVPKEDIAFTDGWNPACTDMGDLSAVMPVVQPHVSGASGAAHGADFFITDFESACVTSAKAQLALLVLLMENEAKRANEVVANRQVIFDNTEDFFKLLDSVVLDKTAIDYTDTGANISFM